MVVTPAVRTVLFAFLVVQTKGASLFSMPEDKSKLQFVLHIQLNLNDMLEENLKIDIKRGTEVIIIPKHKLEVVKDFSKKLDIIFDNKTKRCYVSRQLWSETRPKTLKTLMQNNRIPEIKNDVLTDTSTWKVDALFTQRSRLSKEMALLCARSPIYWIQKMNATGSRQSRDTDRLRVRRHSSCYSHFCWYERVYRIVRRRDGRRIFTGLTVRRCRRIIC